MPSDVLGQRVSDYISAEKDRVLINWRHECVVDDTNNTFLFAYLCDCLDIEDLKSGIGRCLKPYYSCIRLDKTSEFSFITEIFK